MTHLDLAPSHRLGSLDAPSTGSVCAPCRPPTTTGADPHHRTDSPTPPQPWACRPVRRAATGIDRPPPPTRGAGDLGFRAGHDLDRGRGEQRVYRSGRERRGGIARHHLRRVKAGQPGCRSLGAIGRLQPGRAHRLRRRHASAAITRHARVAASSSTTPDTATVRPVHMPGGLVSAGQRTHREDCDGDQYPEHPAGLGSGGLGLRAIDGAHSPPRGGS